MWLGIDFGTSNSSAARLVGGHPHAVREPISHQPFFPSCVLLVPPNGNVEIRDRLVTGVGAERRMLLFPDRFRAELKRNLGEPWPLLLGGEEVPVVDAVGSVIRSLKTEADRMSGGPFPNAMLTVPVAFGTERVALIEAAARTAGFAEVKHCLEPEAAARYHLYVADGRGENEEVLLVYDFGGGTFDASLVRKEGAAFTILASAGIEDCGGRDLDQELFGALVERASPALKAKLAASHAGTNGIADDEGQAILRLRLTALERCRRIKHELSVAETSEADLGDPPELVRFSRKEFEALVAPHLERTLDCCDTLLRGQDIEWSGISRILLVGGTTRIPLVARALGERFERPVRSVEDPELAVSFGASLTFAAAPPVVPLPEPSPEREASISLQAAIDAAAEGAVVRVAPGIYRGALRIEKPLSLVADRGDERERAVIESTDKPALAVAASGVRIAGLALHAETAISALYLGEGELDVEACDIWGGNTACVLAGGGSLNIRRSRIHDGQGDGIQYVRSATGAIEDNEVAGNAKNGIAITAFSGAVSVTGNRVSRNKSGIFAGADGDRATVSGNDCFENEIGIELSGARATPLVRENRLHDNSKWGLGASSGAGGIIERNEIRANAVAGVSLGGPSTSPLVRQNQIDGGLTVGVVSNSAGGLLLENRIEGSDAVRLGNAATTSVRRNEIVATHRCIDVLENGGGVVEENGFEAAQPTATGIFLAAGATTQVRRNRFGGPFAAFFRLMPGAKVRAVNFPGNQIELRPLADETLQTLAAALERADYNAADAESTRLVRTAIGTQIIKNRDEAAAIPADLLKNIDRLWRLALDEPLRSRPWVNSAAKGVSSYGWTGQTALVRRLKDLDL